jgi:hypothetical protein
MKEQKGGMDKSPLSKNMYKSSWVLQPCKQMIYEFPLPWTISISSAVHKSPFQIQKQSIDNIRSRHASKIKGGTEGTRKETSRWTTPVTMRHMARELPS